MQDRAFLISQNKLPVRHVLRWCNRIDTTECPVPNCSQIETLRHFLFECDRSKEVWAYMEGIGFNVEINEKSCRYGIFREKLEKKKSRCKMSFLTRS